jgi:hypothetical protein
VGIEAVGNDQWFVYLLQKLGHEVWIGDAAQIYLRRCHQKDFTVVKVAAACKLAIRMYWILRTQTPYPQVLSSRAA